MKLTLLLLSVVGLVHSYPNGAPPSVCTQAPRPQHGHHAVKTSDAPYDISMSTNQFASLDDIITVTIKARPGGPKFKGFLVLATNGGGEPTGTWEDDQWSHPLSCSGATHDNANEKDEVVLRWKPTEKGDSGQVHMKVAIVQKFDTFWAEIPIQVSAVSKVLSSPTPTHTTEDPLKALSASSSHPHKGDVAVPSGVKKPALFREIVSTAPVVLGPTTAATVKPTANEQLSFINRILGIKNEPSTLTTLQHTTTATNIIPQHHIKKRSLVDRLLGNDQTSTTTPKPTTTKPTTTASTTTKRRSLINRLLGGDGTTPTTKKTTTPKPTTTTKATTTTKRGLINRLFGGDSTIPTTKKTTTPKPTTTTKATTTTKRGLINRLFGGDSTTPTTKKTTTPKPTTTTKATTTTKRGLINRLFGSDSTTPTTKKTTTPKPTTTTTVSTTTKRRSLINRVFGGDTTPTTTTTTTTTTPKPTTTTTTKKPGFFSGLFGDGSN